MRRTHLRTCHLCEAMCGLRIDLDGDRILRIAGDPDDLMSRGHICPKGVALQDLHDDPDRLRQPVIRDGDRWRTAGWTEALDFAAEGLRKVRKAHGNASVAVYQGNPTVHNYGNVLYGLYLIRSLRTPNRFSATSVDQLPHHLVAHQCLGHQLLLPVPDLDRTELMVMLGANPAASNGSLMSAGDVKGRLKAIVARGGELVLFDPRRTKTARLATEHHFVRPGTDALLLSSMLQVIFERGLARTDELPLSGVEELASGVAALTPARTAPVTGVSAEVVTDLAVRLATTQRAVVYGRMGTSTQSFGAVCQWLILALNAVTGHLDRPGGAMFTSPAVDVVEGVFGLSQNGSHGRWKSRVRGLPEVGGELPVSVLSEEMETPGEGQIRALLTLAGNPVSSTPDGPRLARALGQLDFMVSLDHYINESTSFADVILPPASPLTRDHYDLAFHALAVRNTAKWSPPMLQRGPDERHDWEVLLELERRLSPKQGATDRLARTVRATLGPSGVLDAALRLGPYGGRLGLGGLSLHRLRQNPHGVDLGPLQPRLPERLRTEDKRVHLAPPLLMADLPRLHALLQPVENDRRYYLIGRRSLRSNNSWLHNSPRLVRGRNRCTLLMHPDDAAREKLASGSQVEVQSAVGRVEVPLEVSDSVMPGVVCLPHGFGQRRQGVRLRVASALDGVSMNDLTDPSQVDAASGNAVLNGVPVDVRAAGSGAALGTMGGRDLASTGLEGRQ